MTNPTAADAIVAIEREIAMRHLVYPRRIAAGKMSCENCRWQIACMELALNIVKESLAEASPELQLDDAHDNGPAH